MLEIDFDIVYFAEMAIWYMAVSLILVAILVALASVASLLFVFCFRHQAAPMACDYCKSKISPSQPNLKLTSC